MWRSRLARTWDWVLSRKLVGEDKHHFYYTEFIAKGKPERRYVDYKDKTITHCSDRMSVEWWSWLHNRRGDVPTAEEIALSERKQRSLAEKVALLEAEDEKQRLRQFAGGRPGSQGEEQARARRRKNVMLRLAKAAVPPQGGDQSGADAGAEDSGPMKEGRDEGESVRIQADPVGSGEDFQPGAWTPPKAKRRRGQS